MPYIEKKDKDRFKELTNMIDAMPASNPGELNYLVTRMVISYLGFKGLRYQHLNDIMGALEGAKQEFYRRVVSVYENSKIESNGDVY